MKGTHFKHTLLSGLLDRTCKYQMTKTKEKYRTSPSANDNQ